MLPRWLFLLEGFPISFSLSTALTSSGSVLILYFGHSRSVFAALSAALLSSQDLPGLLDLWQVPEFWLSVSLTMSDPDRGVSCQGVLWAGPMVTCSVLLGCQPEGFTTFHGFLWDNQVIEACFLTGMVTWQ